MSNWIICAGNREGSIIENYLFNTGVHGAIAFEDNPWKLRSDLKARPQSAYVIVGEGGTGPSAVNVAASLVHDATALEVLLVVRDASGSLRSRAKRAGIDRVLTLQELERAPFSCISEQLSRRAAACSCKETTWRKDERNTPVSEHAAAKEETARLAKSIDSSCIASEAESAQVEHAASKDESMAREVASTREAAASREVSISKEAGMPREVTSKGVEAPKMAGVPKGGPAAKPGLVSKETLPSVYVQRREGVPVITFVSGRGGVGKTTICALAGQAAASWGLKVALLDLDLAFGNLAALCGLSQTQDLAGLIGDGSEQGELKLNEGARASENLEIFGPCRAPEYAELVQPYVAQIIAALSQTHDLVLIDTTTNWGDAVASAVQQADRLAIVTDGRAGALATLKRCRGLAARLGVASARMVRVLNGCDPKRRDEDFVIEASIGFTGAREMKVMDGGIEAMELLGCGHMADLFRTANPLAASVAKGLAQMLKELGKLPDSEATYSALAGKSATRRLFGRKHKAQAL